MNAASGSVHRRSVRLPGYDYAQPGAYFVTIVAAGRKCIFGRVLGDEMSASPAGDIVRHEWEDLPRRFRFLELGAFVVMPNHFHGILIIHPSVGATRPDSISDLSGDQPFPSMKTDGLEGSPLPKPHHHRRSLGAIIAQFKPRVTKRIWKLPHMRGVLIWQRNYYEHIIRDEKEWELIHRYIESNPAMWPDDAENPAL